MFGFDRFMADPQRFMAAQRIPALLSNGGGGGGGGKRNRDAQTAGPDKNAPMADNPGEKATGKQEKRKKSGGGGGGGGRDKDKGEMSSHGVRQRTGQSQMLTRVEVTRRYSGLVFGIYVLLHVLHQSSAVLGPDRYDAVGRVFLPVITNPVGEWILVWIPLVVHIGSDFLFRLLGGKKGKGARRQVAFISGYALLVLAAIHISYTKIGDWTPIDYDWDRVSNLLIEDGYKAVLFLILLAATASFHVATGAMNVVHQNKSLDRDLRDRVDKAIIITSGLLFVTLVMGVLALAKVPMH